MKKEHDAPNQIDLEEVKNKNRQKQTDEEIQQPKTEVSEERLAQIISDVETSASQQEDKTPAIKQKTKDEVKDEFNRKFEKGKFRTAHFITFIGLILAGGLLIAEVSVVLLSTLKGFVFSASGIQTIFGSDSSVLSVLTGFGYIIYFLILAVCVALCVGTIYFAVLSIIDSSKLNFLKDEDYMLHLRVKRLTHLDIFPLILIDIILIFVLPFFGPTTILQYSVFINIPLAIVHIACLISIFVQSLVSRLRFKKSTTEENYKAVISEKQRINRLYMRRQRSSGGGRLY